MPCCYACNFAKSVITYDEFMAWTNKLKNNYHNLIQTDLVKSVIMTNSV